MHGSCRRTWAGAGVEGAPGRRWLAYGSGPRNIQGGLGWAYLVAQRPRLGLFYLPHMLLVPRSLHVFEKKKEITLKKRTQKKKTVFLSNS